MADSERNSLKAAVNQGDLNSLVEWAAQAGISDEELILLLAEAIDVRASHWARAAKKLGPSGKLINELGVTLTVGGNDFEKTRAKSLRELAGKLRQP